MKVYIFSFVAVITMLSGASALGGPSTSGGGLGVLCKSSDGEKLTLLDLYEPGMNGDGLLQSTSDVVNDYVIAWNRLLTLKPGQKPLNSNQIRQVKKMMEHIQLVNEIWPTNDYGVKTKLPRRCQFRQIAVYRDSDNALLVNRDLWAKLDTLNRAALYMHEILYRDVRTAYFQDSSWVRKLIREIFSSKGPALTGSHSGLIPGKGIDCLAGDDRSLTRFVWQDRKIHLLQVLGSELWIKITVDVPVAESQVRLKAVPLGESPIPEPIAAPVPGTFGREIGYSVQSTGQGFNLANQVLISEIPVSHIRYRHEFENGRLFRIGFDVAGRTLVFPVSHCAPYSGL